MTYVRFLPTKNRLAEALKIAGGKPISAALDDAEAAVAELAPEGVNAIDATLDQIELLLTEEPTQEVLDSLYLHAREIHGIAGVFGFSDLGQGAWCLCEIIQFSVGGEPTNRAALTANLQSLRLLRRGEDLPSAARTAVLEGLEKLVAHKRSKVAPLRPAE